MSISDRMWDRALFLTRFDGTSTADMVAALGADQKRAEGGKLHLLVTEQRIGHFVEHALEPLRDFAEEDSAALALRLVAGQRHFMHAHVVVILASRFARTFWKYRRHAKSYRAVILDAGHLSQMLYLAATECGLAAFITAAVNERDIERTLGIDPLQEGVIAVCGDS